MVFFNPQQEDNLTAFITALSRQESSLPAGLQAQLHSIGQNLENRVVELPTIAASLPELNKAYKTAMAEEKVHQNKEEVTFVSATEKDPDTELLEHAVKILTAPDPVKAAQQDLSQVSGLVASNPLKRLFRMG